MTKWAVRSGENDVKSVGIHLIPHNLYNSCWSTGIVEKRNITSKMESRILLSSFVETTQHVLFLTWFIIGYLFDWIWNFKYKRNFNYFSLWSFPSLFVWRESFLLLIFLALRMSSIYPKFPRSSSNYFVPATSGQTEKVGRWRKSWT